MIPNPYQRLIDHIVKEIFAKYYGTLSLRGMEELADAIKVEADRILNDDEYWARVIEKAHANI